MYAQNFAVALAALLACVHGLSVTVPGTKWCGPGNIADNYDDLGLNVELDTCCRAHDNCAEKISPQEELNGLSNDGLFPIFSCGCEASFRQCLNSLHSIDSAALGRIYFSSANVCFAFGPVQLSCKEQQWDLFRKRCLSYNEDDTKPERWQFYDLAFYTHSDKEQQTEDNQLNSI